MVWRIEHRGCLGTPREIIWPSSSGLALGVGTAVVVIPRVCLCFGHSWFGDVWRVSWRLAVGCILHWIYPNRHHGLVYPNCLLRVQSYSKPMEKKVRLENIDKMTTGNKKERKRHNHEPCFFLLKTDGLSVSMWGLWLHSRTWRRTTLRNPNLRSLRLGWAPSKTRWLEPESSGWVGWFGGLGDVSMQKIFDVWCMWDVQINFLTASGDLVV